MMVAENTILVKVTSSNQFHIPLDARDDLQPGDFAEWAIEQVYDTAMNKIDVTTDSNKFVGRVQTVYNVHIPKVTVKNMGIENGYRLRLRFVEKKEL